MPEATRPRPGEIPFSDASSSPRDDGLVQQLPSFLPSGMPPPETAWSRLALMLVVGVAIALTFAWLFLRATQTLGFGDFWLALPLFVAEVHIGFKLVSYAFLLWNIDSRPAWRPVGETPLRVAVVVTTLDEGEAVILPAVAAAVALEPRHETWVLDDGRRPWVARLAEELGASYLTRPDNRHAKAGNLNNALSVIDTDLIATFDADHVAGPDFLRHTLCYFDDPQVAVVQTAQDFYNLDSFEHEPRWGGRLYSEQEIAYRVLCPAMNRQRLIFWVGTSAVLRVAALRDIGGVATGTVTEDLHTSIRLTKRGWRGVFHNEVLARGLAAANHSQFMMQRNRWAAGAMQVLRFEHLFFGRGLSFKQRFFYLTLVTAWFESWRMAFLLLLPALILLTGEQPVDGRIMSMAPLFWPLILMQLWAAVCLSRDRVPPLISFVFDLTRMPASLAGTLTVLAPRRPRVFRVSPKGRSRATGTGYAAVLVGYACLCAFALLWCALPIIGLKPVTYDSTGIVGTAFFFVAINLLVTTTALRRIRRFGEGSDAALPVKLAAEFNGDSCQVTLVSPNEAYLSLLTPNDKTSGNPAWLRLDVSDQRFELLASVRRAIPEAGASPVIVGFEPGQRRAVAAMMLAILNSATAYPDSLSAVPESELLGSA